MKLSSNPNAFMRNAEAPPSEMFTESPRVPTSYISAVEQAIENYGVESVDSDSRTCTECSDSDSKEESSVFRAQEDFFYDQVITTDKTSLSSSDWGDVACEYDLQESDRVRLMFSAMFGMLFSEEASPVPPQHLTQEASDWMACFPHLRLLGSQVAPPREQGFSLHPGREPADEVETPRTVDKENSEGISLSGRRLEPTSPLALPQDASPSADSEEILASEGTFEEAIAVDYRLSEDDVTEVRRHRRRGLPPMTPSAAIRDSVFNSVFDALWSSWLPAARPLLTRILRGPEDTNLDLCRLPQIGEVDLPGSEQRISSSLGQLPKMAISAEPGVLSSLLHISTKTLQFRERSNLQDIPEAVSTDRRRSTDRNAFPPQSFRAPAAGEAPRVTSAARRGRALHLAPLPRSRSFQVEDEGGLGLRGKRLQGPPGAVEPLSRSGTLPPLSLAVVKAGPITSQRVNSAVGSGLTFAGIRALPAGGSSLGHVGDGRPSTTHTFHTPAGGPRSGNQGLLISGFSFGTAQAAATLSEEDEEGGRVPWGPVYNSSLFPVHQVLRKKSNAINNSGAVR